LGVIYFDVDYRLCINGIIQQQQQLWSYKVEEKLHLGVREQKRLNTTDINDLLIINICRPIKINCVIRNVHMIYFKLILLLTKRNSLGLYVTGIFSLGTCHRSDTTRWLLSAGPWILSWANGWPNDTATGFSVSSLCFPSLIIIPPLLRTHLSPPPEACTIAITRQHIITSSVFKLGASSLIRHLAGYRVKERSFFIVWLD
jgi:hypothetical protein